MCYVAGGGVSAPAPPTPKQTTPTLCSGSSCPFFIDSVVRYPSSYTYPATYETRSLTPVTDYADGTSMFTPLDISATISLDYKYEGGVLGPNGLIYLVPLNADNVGVLNPSTRNFTSINGIYGDNGDWWKYEGGVLGPNGLIYFVPLNADHIGTLELGNTEPAYEVAAGVPEAWSALLSPHYNKF